MRPGVIAPGLTRSDWKRGKRFASATGTYNVVAHYIFSRAPDAQTEYEQRRIAMSLVSLVITLIVVGVLLWLVNTYIPMDSKIKTILNVVVVIAVVLWLLQAFGVLGSLSSVRVG